MYDTTPPGTVAGLAWTSMGGSALYVESTVVKTEKDKARGRQNLRYRKNFGQKSEFENSYRPVVDPKI